MTKLESFDRYTLIKALVLMSDRKERSIVANHLYTEEIRKDLIQSNNEVFRGIIDRLVEKS